MQISKAGLCANNCLDILKLIYSVCPEKLQKTFENIKFQVKDEKDLEMMAKIVENKADVTGQFRDPNDENIPIVFDCMRILNGWEFTDEEKLKAKSLTNIK